MSEAFARTLPELARQTHTKNETTHICATALSNGLQDDLLDPNEFSNSISHEPCLISHLRC